MKRGELYWADLKSRGGSEQCGRRPVVVLSHDAFNTTPTWRSVIVVPLTTSTRGRKGPTAVPLSKAVGGLDRDSIALCHQITTLDRRRLLDNIGRLPVRELRRVEAGICAAIDLDQD